jgi:hypothetical protein
MRLSGKTRDYGGWAVLLALSLFFLVQAFDYGMGTMRRIQAGAVPMLVAGLLAAISGLMLLRTALRRGALEPPADWDMRGFAAVMSGIVVFGATARPFGLVPAIGLTMVVSALGHDQTRLRSLVPVTALVALGCWLLFTQVLRLQLPAFAWPGR